MMDVDSSSDTDTYQHSEHFNSTDSHNSDTDSADEIANFGSYNTNSHSQLNKFVSFRLSTHINPSLSAVNDSIDAAVQAEHNHNNTNMSHSDNVSVRNTISANTTHNNVDNTLEHNSRRSFQSRRGTTERPVSPLQSHRHKQSDVHMKTNKLHNSNNGSTGGGGFGARMLERMGYSGTGGLGKSGQGIAQPILPVVRPAGQGIGVETQQRKISHQQHNNNDQDTGKKPPPTTTRSKQTSNQYITAAELIEQNRANASVVSQNTVVVDMRSGTPSISTLNDISAINAAAKGTLSWSTRLRTSMELLISGCEHEILRIDRQLQQQTVQHTTLQQQQQQLQQAISSQQQYNDAIQQVLNILNNTDKQVKQLQSEKHSHQTGIRLLMNTLKQTQDNYKQPYDTYQLYMWFHNHITPLFTHILRKYRPISSTHDTAIMDAIVLLAEWRRVYTVDGTDISATSIYSQLCNQCIVDKLRIYMLDPQCELAEHRTIITALHTIQSTCTDIVWKHVICHDILYFKIRHAVQSIQLTAYNIDLLHKLVLPYLDAQLLSAHDTNTMLQSIVSILESYINKHWDATVQSQCRTLHQELVLWYKHLSVDQQQSMNYCLLDKLQHYWKHNLTVSVPLTTRATHIINNVLVFVDVLPEPLLLHIVLKQLISGIVLTLGSYLLQPDCDMEAASDFIETHNALLSNTFQSNHTLQHIKARELDMLNAALNEDTHSLDRIVAEASTYVAENISLTKHMRSKAANSINMTDADNQDRMSSNVTIRALLQTFAADNGVIFSKSTTRRSPNGQQVYQFGSELIYIDKDMIYAYNGTSHLWLPVALSELLS